MTTEEGLHRIEERAAMLRYVLDCAALQPEKPDDSALAGMADACADMSRWARALRRAFSRRELAERREGEGV